jgi:hypothetical protein
VVYIWGYFHNLGGLAEEHMLDITKCEVGLRAYSVEHISRKVIDSQQRSELLPNTKYIFTNVGCCKFLNMYRLCNTYVDYTQLYEKHAFLPIFLYICCANFLEVEHPQK